MFSQGITRMNSSGAIGDILVFTSVNLSDNTVYTENRKYSSSSSTSTSTSTGTSISTSTSSTSI